MSGAKFDVVIVGAGAAGIAALKDLDRAGKRVLCLEGRERIGGRICTLHDERSPVPIELGAEFVHGRPPEILRAVESAPLALYSCMEHAVHVRNGRPLKGEDAWLQVDEVMKGMEAAVESGREQSFSEFLKGSPCSREAKELATSYVEGFNAARAGVIGIASLVKDAKAADEIGGDRAFRLMNGYDAVSRWMLQGIEDKTSKLKLRSTVQAIRWESGSASVEFVSEFNGSVQTVKAKHIIVTVPLGVLQEEPGRPGTIRFKPEPHEIFAAAKRLVFGQVVRLILRFQKPVWQKKEFAEAGFLLSNEKHFPTWWTPLPVQAPLLTGWSAGPHADELLGLPKQEIVKRAIHDLGKITSTGEARLGELMEAAYFHDWHSDSFARGAYSYVPAGAMNARERLAQPVTETLYFTGEAMELNGHSATVHGAIASGRRAAKQILGS